MSKVRESAAGLLAVAVVTWAMYAVALRAEAGAYRDPSARGAGLKSVVVAVAERLGTSGVLAAGALGMAAMAASLGLALRRGQGTPDDDPGA